MTPAEAIQAANAAQGAVTAAQEALRLALEARDSAGTQAVRAGLSTREVGALLGMSHTLVQRWVKRDDEARAKEWGGEVRRYTAAERLATAREAFQLARHAQVLREEAFALGYKAETASFYSDDDAPRFDESETRIKWSGFYESAAAERERAS